MRASLPGELFQNPARSTLKRAVGIFPLALTRCGMRNLANQCSQRFCLAAHARQLGKYRFVLGGVHEIHLAVLANPDTRLRAFDPPAADALPCRYVIRQFTTPDSKIHAA
jgi:hypothetical protein